MARKRSKKVFDIEIPMNKVQKLPVPKTRKPKVSPVAGEGELMLLGGVILPSPRPLNPFDMAKDLSRADKEYVREDLWKLSYDACLVAMLGEGDKPLHKLFIFLAGMLKRDVPSCTDTQAVALRFLGEMALAKYIKLKEVKQKKSDKTEREVTLTDKLLRLNIADVVDKSGVIKYPTLSVTTKFEVRRGRNNTANKATVKVVADIAKQEWVVDSFIYDLLVQVPPSNQGVSEALAFKRTMASAELYLHESFFFPQFLDSRGRVYNNTTAGFSPQGADHEKALVVPDHKEVLTKDGFDALVEAALGYSEINWTPEDMAEHARNPIGMQNVWLDADSPYCYIACANKIRQYLDDPMTKIAAYIPLDGRCSGLQHWSALLKTPSIVKHIGMHEEEAERDIYERVADDWKATLPESQQYIATRKACKVPVMTFAYSATRMTSQDNLKNMFGEKSAWNKEDEAFEIVEEGLSFEETLALGGSLYDGLHDTLKDLTVAMKWLATSARTLSKAGNHEITWVTPDGFTASQTKVNGEEIARKVVLSDKSDFQVDFMDFSANKPNSGKHASAIAPNIIHSLDAVHVRMVAEKLAEANLPMVFIHDSFSTHCNHREFLYRTIVDTFIELYSGDYLVDLKKYWEEKYEVELTEIPDRGDWEVESLKSLNLFFK